MDNVTDIQTENSDYLKGHLSESSGMEVILLMLYLRKTWAQYCRFSGRFILPDYTRLRNTPRCIVCRIRSLHDLSRIVLEIDTGMIDVV